MILALPSLAKLWRRRPIHTDCLVFRLHYILTVVILLAFCALNSSKQVFGEPIECETTGKAIDDKIINTFCYIHMTYGLNETKETKVLATEALGPEGDGQGIVNHKYYQWVWLILLCQAICFYCPHYFWKCFAGDRIQSMVSKDLGYFDADDGHKRQRKIAQIINFLTTTRGRNDWFALKYFGCELLAMANVCLQIVINNSYMNNGYQSYGLDVIRWWQSNPSISKDPMIKLFPILAKCRFERFGASGSEENLDALCVLSINILNQKTYFFLWFWMYFLAIITAIVLIFRVIIILCPLMRYYIFRSRVGSQLIGYSGRHKQIVCKLHLGDWFILHLLSKNTEPIVFAEIVEQLGQTVDDNDGGDDGSVNISVYECESKM